MKHNMLKVLLLALCLTLCLGVALAEEKGDLWLTDEKVTLTLWYDFTQEQLGNMADPNEADVFKWLEEQTNVHIEWLIPVSGTEKESFNLTLTMKDEIGLSLFSRTSGRYGIGIVLTTK